MSFKNYRTGSLISFIIVLYIILDHFLPSLKAFLGNLPSLVGKIIETLDILSVPIIIALVFYLIDKVAWRWKVFIWLVDVPNISGRYEGKFNSNQVSGFFDCALEIAQTASKTRIRIFYDNPLEKQKMMLYSILEDVKRNEDRVKVKLIYNNDIEAYPNRNIEPSGAIFLTINMNTKKVNGYYFNRRPHIGDFYFDFSSKFCLGRL